MRDAAASLRPLEIGWIAYSVLTIEMAAILFAVAVGLGPPWLWLKVVVTLGCGLILAMINFAAGIKFARMLLQ